MNKKQLVLDVLGYSDVEENMQKGAQEYELEIRFTEEDDQDIAILTFDTDKEMNVRAFLSHYYDASLLTDKEYLDQIMQGITEI